MNSTNSQQSIERNLLTKVQLPLPPIGNDEYRVNNNITCRYEYDELEGNQGVRGSAHLLSTPVVIREMDRISGKWTIRLTGLIFLDFMV